MKQLLNVELEPGAYLPEQSPDSVGFDLRLKDDLRIMPNEMVFSDTGVILELPKTHWALLSPRSSTGTKNHLMLANTVGIIDPGYRGTIKLAFFNYNGNTQYIVRGTRVAQFVMMPVQEFYVEQASKVNRCTARGDGGFGSTGA